MQINDTELERLAAVAATAAREAGILISNFDGREVEVRRKAGGENIASQVDGSGSVKPEPGVGAIREPRRAVRCAGGPF